MYGTESASAKNNIKTMQTITNRKQTSLQHNFGPTIGIKPISLTNVSALSIELCRNISKFNYNLIHSKLNTILRLVFVCTICVYHMCTLQIPDCMEIRLYRYTSDIS